LKTNLKIAITGPESSGKSTIAEFLAKELDGFLVKEYAVEFLENLKRKYTQEDLDIVANEQFQRWENTPNNKILIADTELIVIKIWSEYKYSKVSSNIIEKLNNQLFDHYYLCKPDIPWEWHEQRENPNDRNELFEMYLKELKDRKLPFTILSGTPENRIQVAKKILSELF